MTIAAPSNPEIPSEPRQRSHFQRVLSSLRAKIILALLAVLALLLLINAILVQGFMLPSFQHVEEQRILIDLERVRQVLQSGVQQVDRVAHSWSSWDDTYNFMETLDQEFAERNLSDAFFEQYDMNVIVMFNSSEKVIYSRYYNAASQTSTAAPPELESYLLARPDLLRFEQLNSSHSGLISVPQGVLLVSLRPVLNDLGEGPSHGTMLLGRILDEQKIAEFSKIIGFSFAVSDIHASNGSTELHAIRSNLGASQATLVQPLNDSVVVGYSLLNDITAMPGVLLRVEQPRDIFRLGQQQSRYLALALGLGGLVIGSVILFVIEQLILRRLLNLDKQVEHIGANNDPKARVHSIGRDELSHLGRSINGMMDAQLHMLQERINLEEARIHVLEREATLRRTLQAVSTPIIPVFHGAFVVPLLGTFDQQRVDELMHIVLDQVHVQRATIVVLDFTGLQDAESDTMQQLIRLSNAISLLGARSILVGISADLAQTLVRLGVSLENSQIAANLQTALMQLAEQQH